MAEQNSFVELVCRARTGDQEAIEELVRRYEPHVRRVASIRLRSARLRRVLAAVFPRQHGKGLVHLRWGGAAVLLLQLFNPLLRRLLLTLEAQDPIDEPIKADPSRGYFLSEVVDVIHDNSLDDSDDPWSTDFTHLDSYLSLLGCSLWLGAR